ncbi:MAG: peptidase M15A [Rhodobiaceae bacterium]|nr:peptidase M15A [Rhodobiaceae bacterium]|tara:strand:- start:618 stop:1169 length:552 start_codon:yes stop_codon:yes gene_type:complete
MRLSEFFTFDEAGHSQTARRLGIDNTPPKQLHPSLAHVATGLLDPVRRKVGHPVTVSSWYRSPALERVLCGSSFLKRCKRLNIQPDETAWGDYLARKQHPKGEAFDLEIPGIPNYELALWIQQNLRFDQLILEFHERGKPGSGWVHASLSRGRNRNQVLTIGKGFAHQGLPDYGPLTHPKLLT